MFYNNNNFLVNQSPKNCTSHSIKVSYCRNARIGRTLRRPSQLRQSWQARLNTENWKAMMIKDRPFLNLRDNLWHHMNMSSLVTHAFCVQNAHHVFRGERTLERQTFKTEHLSCSFQSIARENWNRKIQRSTPCTYSILFVLSLICSPIFFRSHFI